MELLGRPDVPFRVVISEAVELAKRCGATDGHKFVNGVLDDIRADGTWERLYQAHLQPLGPSPGPPIPRYQD